MKNAGSQPLPETQRIWAKDPEICAITTLGNVMLVNVQELCVHTACSHFGVFAWLVLNPTVSNVMCRDPAKCPQAMPASPTNNVVSQGTQQATSLKTKGLCL